MPRKTNKTSHVLSLLTQETAEDDASLSSSPSESSSEIQERPVSRIMVSEEDSRELSQKIHEQLLTQYSPVPSQPPAPERSDRQPENVSESPEPKPEEAEEPSATSEASSVSSPSPVSREKTETEQTACATPPQNLSAGQASPDPEEAVLVDISRELVLSSPHLNSYLERYARCTCNQCRMDAVALTLKGLPVKYATVKRKDIPALLAKHAPGLQISIMRELVKACLTVASSPRHDRS